MTKTPYEITGLILAGGASQRMGRPKAQLELAGQTLVERVREKLEPLCRELIIVTKQPTDFINIDLMVVSDLVPRRGPLGGLVTGLFYAHYPWSIVLACDLPFVNEDLLHLLIKRAVNGKGGSRAVIPKHTAGWEPLVACYSKDCLPWARKLLLKENPSLLDLKENGVRVDMLSEEEMVRLDPKLDSFVNINTPEDFELAEELLKK